MSDRRRELPASETWQAYESELEAEDARATEIMETVASPEFRSRLVSAIERMAAFMAEDPSVPPSEIQFMNRAGEVVGRIVDLSVPVVFRSLGATCRHEPFPCYPVFSRPLPGTLQRCRHCGEWFTYGG